MDGADGPVIRVSVGTGTGRTPLSAFDGALFGAGIANYNLVRLSSVIPPGATVVTVAPEDQLAGGFGDRLYCVYASATARTPGTGAWAGVAWSRRTDGSGAGLFVEHTGSTEAELRQQLTATLSDMGERRGGGFRYEDALVGSVQCEDAPACVVVIATYRALPWTGPSRAEQS